MINWFIWKWYVVIRAISLFQEDVSSQSHLDSYAFYIIYIVPRQHSSWMDDRRYDYKDYHR